MTSPLVQENPTLNKVFPSRLRSATPASNQELQATSLRISRRLNCPHIDSTAMNAKAEQRVVNHLLALLALLLPSSIWYRRASLTIIDVLRCSCGCVGGLLGMPEQQRKCALGKRDDTATLNHSLWPRLRYLARIPSSRVHNRASDVCTPYWKHQRFIASVRSDELKRFFDCAAPLSFGLNLPAMKNDGHCCKHATVHYVTSQSEPCFAPSSWDLRIYSSTCRFVIFVNGQQS